LIDRGQQKSGFETERLEVNFFERDRKLQH